MRRRAPRELGSALDELRRELAPATTLARVQGLWRSAVGAVVAREASPVSERAGAVTIACRSAVWAQELSLMSSELLERVNGNLGTPDDTLAVRELRFVVRDP